MTHPAGVIERAVELRAWGETHLGLTRNENQDLFFVGEFPTPGRGETPLVLGPESRASSDGTDPGFRLGPMGAIFAVADGMGGAAAGARASRVTLDTVVGHLESFWFGARVHTAERFARALAEAVEKANDAVHRAARADMRLAGMGATLTLAGVLDGVLHLAQVGDSRAYILRRGALVQLTVDQSLVQALVDGGALTPEDAATSPHRNVVLQAIGPEPELEVSMSHVGLRRDDLVLLCSDGLSGEVKDADIARILTGDGTLRERCGRLIQAALDAGGKDNVTVVLVQAGGEGLAPPSASDRPVAHPPSNAAR